MSLRITPIIRKEFIHIRRDFRTLVIVIIMPVVMLFLYGYAINMEIQNIDLVVLDRDQSPESAALVRKFEGSKFFTVYHYNGPESQVEAFFNERAARMILMIPAGFSKNLGRQLRSDVQVLVDASDPNAAQAIRNYANAVFQTFNAGLGSRGVFEIETAIWYNPALKSAYFFVPGLAALILMMISALLTSIAIVREKETGTMEQILVSPVRPIEIIMGKVIPYILLAFIDLLIILIIARFVFDVPFVGAIGFLLAASLVFIFTALSLGLIISTRAATQQVAMMAALIMTLLPTVMLSGFIFPISSLPKILQMITYIVPATYFLVIIRGIMLKGNTLPQLLPQIMILAGISAILIIASAKKFKTTLES